jgi:osmotically-inducible protein OsmY
MFTRLARTPILLLLLIGCTGANAVAQPATSSISNDDIRRDVIQRLAKKEIRGVDASVSHGVVTLRGSVPTLWTREKAIEQARKIGEVTVVSELTIPRGETDSDIAQDVATRLQRYVFYTIFDDAVVEVDDGVVTLTGRVTMPHKASAFADLAARVAGVQAIRNEIRTLPASGLDDELRYAVAREIYGDSVFAHYAIHINPPVHIIVERGAVTLTGVVYSELERRKAEAIARSTFLVRSVVNELRVDRGD